MGDHQAGNVVLRHNLFRQSQYLLRRGGVKGGSVFVQKQQLGRYQRRHQQRQRLTLAAGQQTHGMIHPVFQPQLQLRQLFPESGTILRRDHGEGRPFFRRPQIGQRQIFLDGHAGGGAFQGVLKEPADEFAALVIRKTGDILPVQTDGSLVHHERTGDRAEQGGFARAVGAENGDKIAAI